MIAQQILVLVAEFDFACAQMLGWMRQVPGERFVPKTWEDRWAPELAAQWARQAANTINRIERAAQGRGVEIR